MPFGCPLIGVELSDDAVPLDRFWHPQNAVYLMGAEDHGLPDSVLEKCHSTIQIPAPREWSMNVAVAGSIVLYDRYLHEAFVRLERDTGAPAAASSPLARERSVRRDDLAAARSDVAALPQAADPQVQAWLKSVDARATALAAAQKFSAEALAAFGKSGQ